MNYKTPSVIIEGHNYDEHYDYRVVATQYNKVVEIKRQDAMRNDIWVESNDVDLLHQIISKLHWDNVCLNKKIEQLKKSNEVVENSVNTAKDLIDESIRTRRVVWAKLSTSLRADLEAMCDDNFETLNTHEFWGCEDGDWRIHLLRG